MKAAATVGLIVAFVLPGSAVAQTPGSAGLGDPYFPKAGNGGYQVDSYDLALRVNPRKGRIAGAVGIAATATQALSAFNLDMQRMRVGSVTVDGIPAAHRRKGSELTVLPASAITAGAAFNVTVSYGGVPKPVISAGGIPTGWLRTKDGAFVASEPRGAHGWFPCNDHPSDKATFTTSITVPRRTTAVANGTLESVTRSGNTRTFVWREPEPMATYLATATTGNFRLRRSTAAGIPSWTAVAPPIAKQSRRGIRNLARVTRHLAGYLGPYPFSSTGLIADPGFPGLVLETQTRPIFGEPVKTGVLAHEIAHQWFGNSVTPERWSDIWLNEGFATWAEWNWYARGKDRRLRKIFRGWYRTPARYKPLWSVRVADPGPKKLFSLAIYNRGGMTLEALRGVVGDATFKEILRRWLAERRHGNGTTAQFTALAQEVSGRDLGRFFDVWIRSRGKPRNWG